MEEGDRPVRHGHEVVDPADVERLMKSAAAYRIESQALENTIRHWSRWPPPAAWPSRRHANQAGGSGSRRRADPGSAVAQCAPDDINRPEIEQLRRDSIGAASLVRQLLQVSETPRDQPALARRPPWERHHAFATADDCAGAESAPESPPRAFLRSRECAFRPAIYPRRWSTSRPAECRRMRLRHGREAPSPSTSSEALRRLQSVAVVARTIVASLGKTACCTHMIGIAFDEPIELDSQLAEPPDPRRRLRTPPPRWPRACKIAGSSA
jgi:hypothetical protein